MTLILQVDPKAPREDIVDQAVTFLKDGQAIAYPTETIYGLGADVFNAKAIKKIYELKTRDYGLPISILISDLSMLRDCVDNVSDRAMALIHRFWPGPLTILFPAAKRFPKNLITNTDKIGIRFSSHPVATLLVQRFGSPITTTSANLSDFPPSLQVKHIQKYFGEKLPCVLDGGECIPSRGSTVVDVSEESMRIVREGVIAAEEVIRCFQGRD